MSCADLVPKLTGFFKGSHCDHFDSMIHDISQVTQLNENLIMSEETFKAPLSSLFGDQLENMAVKMTTMWVHEHGEEKQNF